MLFAPNIPIRPLSRFSEFSSNISEKHFYVMFLVAILLHVSGILIYQFLPHEEVIQIPVRALNIKLGGGPTPVSGSHIPSASIDYAATPQDMTSGSKELQSVLDSAFASVKDDMPQVRNITQQAAHEANGMPSQFVREGMAPTGVGSALGSVSGEELMRRYEQVLSLWIERHKIYPSSARAGNMEGDAIIRIRINRKGNIMLYKLEQPTRFDVLNSAIIDMIRSANPVPAVPPTYPPGDRFEFLIPVSFRLQ